VVGDGVEVGLQRAHRPLPRTLVPEHVQVVGGVPKPRVGGHGLFVPEQTMVGGHHDREARDEGECRLFEGDEAQSAGPHAQRVHLRGPSRGDRPQDVQGDPRQNPRRPPSAPRKAANSPASGNPSCQRT
jgi:hypothetical protein